MEAELFVTSRRVVTPEGERPATIAIANGRIVSLGPAGAQPTSGATLLDVGDQVVMPGLVDTHAHINEPGRTEWEGFATATAAAALGGITTVVDMPLNSNPVTTTLESFRVKERAAAGQCFVDYALWGGVVPGNARELDALIDAGVPGFKAFLVHSGIDDFPMSTEADLREAMPILARRGVPLLVHAELERDLIPSPSTGSGQASRGTLAASAGASSRYSTYLASRPADWETAAVELMVKLCRETRCPVHVVHLSAADALDAIRRARADKLPFTVETCPHYLTLCAEEVPDRRTEFKCAPPIRERENRERLWEGLRSHDIDLVVSDHSPCTPALKLPQEGDFLKAWGGISSLQLGLSLIWTQARERGFSLNDLARWMSERPAALAGLGACKGRLAAGCDADFIVFDPDARQTITPSMLRHRHPVTPYVGVEVSGLVRQTWLRGKKIHDGGALAGKPQGRRLSRGETHG